MRALAALPLLALLGACQVTKDENENSATVELSGDAAVNGTAAALNGISDAVDATANGVEDLGNQTGAVQNGVRDVAASANRLGGAVENSADKIGDAADRGADDAKKKPQ